MRPVAFYIKTQVAFIDFLYICLGIQRHQTLNNTEYKMEAAISFPIIETERLNLVEIRQEHLQDLFLLFGDDKVTRYYNIKTFRKPEDGQIYLDWFRNRFKEGLGIRWGLQPKGETYIIGTIGYNNFAQNHRANLGYDLQSAFWNKGYMSEAIKAVLDFGFNNLNVNRIEAEVMSGNQQSERLLCKLGFKDEGCLRDWMYWDNRHFDMIMYSLLREEWLSKIGISHESR